MLKANQMNIYVNTNSLRAASNGAINYYKNVETLLTHEIKIEYIKKYDFGKLNRVIELCEFRHGNSILWSPTHRGPLFAKNHIITVLDCINIEYVYKNDYRLTGYLKLFRNIYKNARKIITISNVTKNKLIEYFDLDNDKIIVNQGPNSLNLKNNYLHDQKIEVINTFDSKHIFLFSSHMIHKNSNFIIKALCNSLIVQELNIPIVIVGDLSVENIRILNNNKIKFKHFKNISSSQLVSIYKNSLFFISASLSEGLNLTIAEALSVKIPVLCSDIDTHREFYDGSVYFFNPLDLDNAISQIDNLSIDFIYKTSNYKFRNDLDLRSIISYKDVADKYIKIFRDQY